MEEKTQYEAIMEELQKMAENFRAGVVEIGEALAKILPDVEIPEEEEDEWEMKCPYKVGDEHYNLQPSGDVFPDRWEGIEADNRYFSQGNTFLTEQSAKLEAKRRNLLTRFKAFRDECNGDWKVDWSGYDRKWSISRNEDGLFDTWTIGLDTFTIFGYFKNKTDCERAIELFGDEIIELFVNLEEE